MQDTLRELGMEDMIWAHTVAGTRSPEGSTRAASALVPR
jgi:hypothetical protein